ncbi:hypothetical protein [Enterococcus sp. HY326]|uniref:hypothetical protein n=1 Tax=Enterococcus sp. HY326 TaxID=2971265 RepID=UPI00223EA643|nr:hypothetical protein [Enterococcus sp. HY326]
MTVLEWVFIGCLASAILFLIFAIFFFIRYFQTKKKIKRLPKKKVRNKKKRKRFAIQKMQLEKRKKRNIRSVAILLILTLIAGGGAGYVNYYQAMNLSVDDADSIVKSYYLIRDFEDQIQLAKDQQDEQDKLQKNIRYLSTSMASYGTLKASELNTTEGQIALNRYYNAIKELGVNGSANYTLFYGNTELSDEYLQDIEKVKSYEKQVFDFYNVDEAALLEE